VTEENLLQLRLFALTFVLVRTFDSCCLSRGGNDDETLSHLGQCEMNNHIVITRVCIYRRTRLRFVVGELLLRDLEYRARSRWGESESDPRRARLQHLKSAYFYLSEPLPSPLNLQLNQPEVSILVFRYVVPV
jgi:hypothetical protein